MNWIIKLIKRFVERFQISRNLWIKIRARQQEYEIKSERIYFKNLVRERNINKLTKEEVKSLLQKRLSSRGIEVNTDRCRDLRILYASSMDGWEPYQTPPALKKFGELVVYNLKERGFNPRNVNWIKERDSFQDNLLNFVKEQNTERPIDVFISYLSGWHISPKFIKKIGALGIITCNFCWDDKLSFRGKKKGGRWIGPAPLASAYDLNLTNSPSSIIKYFAEGGLGIFWPEAANPEHFKPLGREFEYDVSFIGKCYGQRPNYINFLRNHDIQVETFGSGWPNGIVSPQEMVEIYSKSRINLGFSGIGYSMKEMCLKGRDFEIPMSGALYLTTEHPDIHLVYKVGQEIVTYLNKREMLEKVLYLLKHPDECEIIRRAARKRCLRDHSWESRFHHLLTITELLEE